MNTKSVITIGREFASGGKDIAMLVAKRLEVEFYDRKLIFSAAKASGISPEIFENVDEHPTNSLLYSLSMGMYNLSSTGYSQVNNLPLNDQLYLLQHNIIKDLGASPCVIVGRCANYVLRELKNTVNIFICADFDYRVEKAITDKGIAKVKSQSAVRKADKTRGNYYNFYTDLKWGEASTYDLCINRTKLTDEQVVDIIINYVKMKDSTY